MYGGIMLSFTGALGCFAFYVASIVVSYWIGKFRGKS